MPLESPIPMVAPTEFPQNLQIEIEPAIRLKQFDMLYSSLGELHKKFMNGTAASAGLILLGIVWFANTKDPAPFLSQFPHFLWIVTLAPVLGALLYSYYAWLAHKRSQKLTAALDSFYFMSKEAYETNAVSRNQFFIFSAGVLLLGVILGGCIYGAGKAAPDDQDDSSEEEVIMQVSLHPTQHRSFGLANPVLAARSSATPRADSRLADDARDPRHNRNKP
jgi:hypothetical protein